MKAEFAERAPLPKTLIPIPLLYAMERIVSVECSCAAKTEVLRLETVEAAVHVHHLIITISRLIRHAKRGGSGKPNRLECL